MAAPANLGHTPPHSRQWLHEELFSVVATWTNGARESGRALITETITTIAGGGNKENFVSTEETTKRSRFKAHPYGAVAIPRLRELGTNGRVVLLLSYFVLRGRPFLVRLLFVSQSVVNRRPASNTLPLHCVFMLSSSPSSSAGAEAVAVVGGGGVGGLLVHSFSFVPRLPEELRESV